MLREINDLADVIGVMSDLTIDSLDDRVVLTANRYGAHQIVRPKRLDCRKDTLPTLFPIRQHLVFGCTRQHLEFHVAIALRLLAVSGKKVSPARQHVARHVLHVDGNAVRLFVGLAKEIFVTGLRKRAFGEFLVIAKGLERVIEIVLGW